MQVHHRTRGRKSFTLLELMIVIAIISILISIAVGAYFRVYDAAKILEVRSDISQMEVALAKFKAQYGVYPPSRVKLCYNYASYNTTNNPLDQESVQFLTTLFGPRIVTGSPTTPSPPWVTAGSGIDWTGQQYTTGTVGMPASVVLEGDQCLVYFLGTLFYNNPYNPMDSSTHNPINPLEQFAPVQPIPYQFQKGRLVNLPHSGEGSDSDATGIFPSYRDPYGKQVYAYFSAYSEFQTANGYNRYFISGQYQNSDCSSLQTSPEVWPYASASGQYQNEATFQIICAGKDGIFGPGSDLSAPLSGNPTLYWPENVSLMMSLFPNGKDDVSNFYGTKLGF
jgi:prepilin-type N-terminal cleavage/methylation domain-containing protein